MQNTRQNALNKSAKQRTFHAFQDKQNQSATSKADSSVLLPSSQNPADILSKIFSFNSFVGKGILFCLQNQYNLSQFLLEAIQTLQKEKSFEYGSSLSKTGQVRASKVDESVSNDIFSFHLESNKEKGIASLASKIENFMNEISGLLTMSELKQTEQSQAQREDISPKKVTKKWKQENKRTSVPLITKGQDSYFSGMRKMRKNSNLIDDRRVITDNSLSGISKVPFTALENLTFESKDNKDFLPKKEIFLTDTKTPKITLKLNTPQTFTKSRKNSKIIDPSPKEIKENPKPLFGQLIKDIHPPNEGIASTVKNTTPKQQKLSDKGKTLSDILDAQPKRKLSPNKGYYEETTLHLNSQNTSVIQMTLVDDTERVVKPSDLEDEGTPLEVISGTGNIPLMEKRVIKGILEEESRELALAISQGSLLYL